MRIENAGTGLFSRRVLMARGLLLLTLLAVLQLTLVACGSGESDQPLTLVAADLAGGVEPLPSAGAAVADIDETGSETRWATFVYVVRLRNDGQQPMRNIETRLVPSDALLEAYDGSDPFAAAGGRRVNYGELPFTLEPGRELEVRRGIRVASLPIEQGDDIESSPAVQRLTRLREIADQAVLEVSWELGTERFGLLGLLEPEDWPPFTMVYELEQGQVASVGNRRVDSRQVRRFEYRSANEWVDTVIESAPIKMQVGTFSAVGSYTRLYGRKRTEFDAVVNSVSEEEIDDGVLFVPNAFLTPLQNQALALEEAHGLTPTRVETGVLVCFRDECQVNAAGLLYRLEDGRVHVFADDSRGFLLKMGDAFVVRALRVDDERR